MYLTEIKHQEWLAFVNTSLTMHKTLKLFMNDETVLIGFIHEVTEKKRIIVIGFNVKTEKYIPWALTLKTEYGMISLTYDKILCYKIA